MDVFGNALSSGLSNLFNAVPVIIGALIILAVFWIVSGILGKLISRVLQKVGFDTILQRVRVDQYLRQAGVNLVPSSAIGGFIKWFIRIIGLSAVASSLGLSQVSSFLNAVLTYLPNVLVAVIILMLGMLIAQFASKLASGAATAARFNNAPLIGKLAQYAILFFVGLIVLEQLGVGSGIVLGLWAAVSGGLSLALAIAVGLGGREVTHSFLNSKAISQDFQPGMTIALAGGPSGRVVKVTTFYTTLATERGQLKVPNTHLTANSITVLTDTTSTVNGLPSSVAHN